MQRTPQTIAAHLRTIATTIAALALPGNDANKHNRTLRACAHTLDHIDLHDIAASLANERACAAEGRPRGEHGVRSRNAISNPTADIAAEMHRIIDLGMDLQRALDRLMPDADWPTIESGWRAMSSTSSEDILLLIEQVRHGEAPAIDLADAVETCADNVRLAHQAAQRAASCRAWLSRREDASEVDPPDPILEAMRCTATDGYDKDGHPIRCPNFVGEEGHQHPDTGTKHHMTICDEHYQALCPCCFSRPRRTAGARHCEACHRAAHRRAAA